jgi:VIT1/CCC1 family predicted Fe2+/Mn2+ transporter
MSAISGHDHPGDHQEGHSTISGAVRDVVLGMADGLTVPFALAAGVAAVASTHIVVTAGVAEIAAGAIAMALGGYLAARGEADHFAAERARELRETHHIPDEERREVAGILEHYGLPAEQARATAQALSEDRTRWVDFMMRFELGLETPDPRRAPRSALTIGASYIAGGLIPLAPYFFIAQVERALPWSAALTLAALFGFGAAKGAVTDGRPWRSAVQTMAIGSLASAAAFTLARLVA